MNGMKDKRWKFSAEYLDKRKAMREYMSWEQKELATYTYKLTISLSELQAKYDKLSKELSEMTSVSHYNLESKALNAAYSENWAVQKKILYAVAINKRPMIADDIFEFIKSIDKRFKASPPEARNFYGYISRAIQKKFIVSLKLNEYPKRLYVLASWLDKNGKLMKMYSEKIETF
jgi:hypothetical protein